MKWYKRDPSAALAGMIGLTIEERGAYNTLLDLLYDRDLDVTDEIVTRALCCRPQVWRRLRASLIAKGKVRVKDDGKLTANRVETEVQTARKLISNMSELGKVSAEKRRQNKDSSPTGPLVTTTTTSTTREEREEKMPRKRGRPKVPLPDNWHPAEELSSDDLFELERFKNHARANDRRCADWFAAWRNWKTSPYRKGGQNGRNGTDGADRKSDFRSALAKLREYADDAGTSEEMRESGGSVAGLLPDGRRARS